MSSFGDNLIAKSVSSKNVTATVLNAEEAFELVGKQGTGVFILQNLPTAPGGSVTSNYVYTQKASELGGSGDTKVLCIV